MAENHPLRPFLVGAKEKTVAIKTINISCSNTAVGTTLEDVGNSVDVKCRSGMMIFQVRNNDVAVALVDFSVMVKANENADWVNLITGTGWGTVAGALKHAPTDIHTLAANTSAVVMIDVSRAYQVKFQAASASSTVSLDILGTAEFS